MLRISAPDTIPVSANSHFSAARTVSLLRHPAPVSAPARDEVRFSAQTGPRSADTGILQAEQVKKVMYYKPILLEKPGQQGAYQSVPYSLFKLLKNISLIYQMPDNVKELKKYDLPGDASLQPRSLRSLAFALQTLCLDTPQMKVFQLNRLMRDYAAAKLATGELSNKASDDYDAVDTYQRLEQDFDQFLDSEGYDNRELVNLEGAGITPAMLKLYLIFLSAKETSPQEIQQMAKPGSNIFRILHDLALDGKAPGSAPLTPSLMGFVLQEVDHILQQAKQPMLNEHSGTLDLSMGQGVGLLHETLARRNAGSQFTSDEDRAMLQLLMHSNVLANIIAESRNLDNKRQEEVRKTGELFERAEQDVRKPAAVVDQLNELDRLLKDYSLAQDLETMITPAQKGFQAKLEQVQKTTVRVLKPYLDLYPTLEYLEGYNSTPSQHPRDGVQFHEFKSTFRKDELAPEDGSGRLAGQRYVYTGESLYKNCEAYLDDRGTLHVGQNLHDNIHQIIDSKQMNRFHFVRQARNLSRLAAQFFQQTAGRFTVGGLATDTGRKYGQAGQFSQLDAPVHPISGPLALENQQRLPALEQGKSSGKPATTQPSPNGDDRLFPDE